MFRKFGMNDVKIIFCTLVFIPKLSFQMPEINVYFLPDDMTFLDLSQVWLLLLHFSTALGILSQNIFFWLISLLNREHFGFFFLNHTIRMFFTLLSRGALSYMYVTKFEEIHLGVTCMRKSCVKE